MPITSCNCVKIGITVGMSQGVRIAGRVTRSNDESGTTTPEILTLSGAAVGDAAEALLKPDGSSCGDDAIGP
jgi:hypothetical protein